jgi:hypothetical protein
LHIFISAFNSNFCHGSEKLQNEIIKLSSNSLKLVVTI